MLPLFLLTQYGIFSVNKLVRCLLLNERVYQRVSSSNYPNEFSTKSMQGVDFCSTARKDN